MKITKAIALLLIYLFSYIVLTLYFVDILSFCMSMPMIEPFNSLMLGIIRNISLLFFIIIYGLSLFVALIEINQNNFLNNNEKKFWVKVIFLKPLSGLSAYNFSINFKFESNKIIQKVIIFSHLFRTISIVTVVISIFTLFVIHSSNLSLVFLFFGVYFSIITHFIFEPFIITDGWSKGRSEWEKYDYYQYFSSIKSILGYNNYYRKYF